VACLLTARTLPLLSNCQSVTERQEERDSQNHFLNPLSPSLPLSLFSLFTFSPSIFSLPATHHHSLLCSVPHVIALPFLPLPGSLLLSLPHFHPSLSPSLSPSFPPSSGTQVF